MYLYWRGTGVLGRAADGGRSVRRLDVLAQVAGRQRTSRLTVLSSREQEIVEYVAEGWANREIAERLCLSVRTVEAHKNRAVKKLGLLSSRDLLIWAVRKAP